MSNRLLKKRNLIARLSPVYENSMGSALHIQARDGLDVAWLPQSLVEPDISSGLLIWTGGEEWAINVDIRLHRLRRNHDMLIRKIWTFLKLREEVALI
jgi:DNA-binding transcriptional LysR family regulator